MLAGEQKLLESQNGALVLTSSRVRFDGKAGGQTRLVSMALESVASCCLTTRSYPFILAVAALALLYGLTANGAPRLASFIFSVGAVVVFFVSRSAVLEICSAGGEKVAVAVQVVGKEETVAFIDALESAKLGLPQVK